MCVKIASNIPGEAFILKLWDTLKISTKKIIVEKVYRIKGEVLL